MPLTAPPINHGIATAEITDGLCDAVPHEKSQLLIFSDHPDAI